MKILYLTGYRYPNSLDEPLTSGDLRYSFTLSRALARLGHEVNVLTRKEGDDPNWSNLDEVKIHRYKSEFARLFSTSFDISFNRYRLFKKLIKDADLLICNSPLSLEHLIKIKVPIIYVASGLEDVKNYSLTPKEIISSLAIKLLREPLKRKTWKKSQLVNTTALYEEGTLNKWSVPKVKIGTISSSVDISRYKPQAALAKRTREELGLKPTDRLILSVSRFTPAKGLTETIKAFDLIASNDCKLLIIGVHHSHDSSYYSKVLQTIKKCKNSSNIILKENIPESVLPAYYSAADITSVFSIGYDPLPTVIIESMACGTPVVSTYYKTRRQFIDNGETGLFVTEGDLEDWVDKTRKLLNSSSLRNKLSENGINSVRQRFDSINIAKEYLGATKHE